MSLQFGFIFDAVSSSPHNKTDRAYA